VSNSSAVTAALKWWTLAVVGSGTFMSALDTSVVNIALPSIGLLIVSRVIQGLGAAMLLALSPALLIMHRLAHLPGAYAVQAGLQQGLLVLSCLSMLAAVLCLARNRTPAAGPARAPEPA